MPPPLKYAAVSYGVISNICGSVDCLQNLQAEVYTHTHTYVGPKNRTTWLLIVEMLE